MTRKPQRIAYLLPLGLWRRAASYPTTDPDNFAGCVILIINRVLLDNPGSEQCTPYWCHNVKSVEAENRDLPHPDISNKNGEHLLARPNCRSFIDSLSDSEGMCIGGGATSGGGLPHCHGGNMPRKIRTAGKLDPPAVLMWSAALMRERVSVSRYAQLTVSALPESQSYCC